MSLIKTSQIYSQKLAQKNLPSRRKQDNKTKGGKVLVVAGSVGMWGASQLAAQAASRCGAGYIYVLEAQKNNPDFLTTTISQIRKNLFDACVLGPGFRRPKTIGLLIRHWLEKKQNNVVPNL